MMEFTCTHGTKLKAQVDKVAIGFGGCSQCPDNRNGLAAAILKNGLLDNEHSSHFKLCHPT